MGSGTMETARARVNARRMGSVWTLRRLLACAAFVAITAVLVGVPLAASANPDINGFELDGNAAGERRERLGRPGQPAEVHGLPSRPHGRHGRGLRLGSDEGHEGHQPVVLGAGGRHAGEVRHRPRLRRGVRGGRQPHPLLRAEPPARRVGRRERRLLAPQEPDRDEPERHVLGRARGRRPAHPERVHERRQHFRHPRLHVAGRRALSGDDGRRPVRRRQAGDAQRVRHRQHGDDRRPRGPGA